MITERQEEILNRLVEEYIDSALPVSSKLLEKKYDFGICPASIRIEMQRLTDTGFISQPHTSAGRVPTDKGYRFFVNSLFEKGFQEKKDIFKLKDLIEEEMGDTTKFLQLITKNLATISSNLALGYLSDENIFWKEGWEGVLQEPEFKERGIIANFADVIKHFEKDIEGFKINSDTRAAAKSKRRTSFSPSLSLRESSVAEEEDLSSSPIRVYIGRENPFSKAKEFSIIIASCHLPEPQRKAKRIYPLRPPERERGVLALLGPKRMPYERNISSLNSLAKLLEKL